VSSAASPTAGPRPTGSARPNRWSRSSTQPHRRGPHPVAPKPHVEDIVAADPGFSVTVFAATRTVVGAIEAALDIDGYP
jgi:hypothetical protein